MKLVATKTTGGTYSAEEFNELPSQELQNAVLDSDQALNEADLQQLGKAVSIYAAGGDFYTDSGAANAYVLSTVGSKLAPPALFNGMKISFITANTNTAASTVNVDGLGVVAIEYNGLAIVASKIVADQIIECVYVSANSSFELINSISSIDDQATSTQLTLSDTGAVLDGAYSSFGANLTIAAGRITVTHNFHIVDTEASGATDDLTHIDGGTESQILVLKPFISTRDITYKDSAGGSNQLVLAGDFAASTSSDILVLLKSGDSWFELSRSDNL